MKRLLVIGLVVVVAVVVAAAPGPAQPSQDPALARQVAALQKQVKTLQKQVKTLQTQQRQTASVAIGAFGFAFCSGALVADALVGTWTVIDQLAQATQSRTYFTDKQSVDDRRVCAELNIQRSQAAPPTLAQLRALYAIGS